MSKIRFDLDGEPDCGFITGYALPKVDYAIKLPGLKGSFSVALPNRVPVGAGVEEQILLSVGIKTSLYDRCTIRSTVALEYLDGTGKTRTTKAWSEQLALTIHPISHPIRPPGPGTIPSVQPPLVKP